MTMTPIDHKTAIEEVRRLNFIRFTLKQRLLGYLHGAEITDKTCAANFGVSEESITLVRNDADPGAVAFQMICKGLAIQVDLEFQQIHDKPPARSDISHRFTEEPIGS